MHHQFGAALLEVAFRFWCIVVRPLHRHARAFIRLVRMPIATYAWRACPKPFCAQRKRLAVHRNCPSLRWLRRSQALRHMALRAGTWSDDSEDSDSRRGVRLDTAASPADIGGGAVGAAPDVALDVGGWSDSGCGASENLPESDAEGSAVESPGPLGQDGDGPQLQVGDPVPEPPLAVPVEAAIVDRAHAALCALAESAGSPAMQDLQLLWDCASDDALVDKEELAFLDDLAACRSITNLTTVCERTGKDPRKVEVNLTSARLLERSS